MTKSLLFLLVILCFAILFLPISVHAQQSNSSSPKIQDTQAVGGDILFTSNLGLVRASTKLSGNLYGILQTDSSDKNKTSSSSSKLVTTTGIAKVNVTNINGNIEEGNPVTFSVIEGKGQKATNSGFIVGRALENFTPANGKEINYQGKRYISGQVMVVVKIEYLEIDDGSLVNGLNEAIQQETGNPKQALKIAQYTSSVLIIILGFVLSFFTFSGSIAKGVEALGRNPKAKRSIQTSIVINIILTIIVSAVSIIASILVLRF